MGRKGRLLRPNVVLARTAHTGMTALVRLLASRTKNDLRGIFNSADDMWAAVRQELAKQDKKKRDNLPLKDVEPNLRKCFLEFLWLSTRPYGNTESKRVYDWTEGTVGPLNALLNYAGARLRDLATTRYPFPDPQFYQIWKYPDGSTKIHSKELIDKIGSSADYSQVQPEKEEQVKTYWKAGYSGTSNTPRVFLAHPTLPSLDFIDVIRAHLIELCRQCFIYNVPRSEAHRYIRLLLHRLRPFLDWIYTEQQLGEPYFNRESD